jgi:hypothetical protein
MSNLQQWWNHLDGADNSLPIDGLVQVRGYNNHGRPPEEVVMMEKALDYGATAVFFEAARNEKPPVAQAFIYIADSLKDDPTFAEIHQKLWSWGGVPLVYRKLPGCVQLFRCAHGPDFVSKTGEPKCNPVKTLLLASAVSADPWWNVEQLRNGTLWDNTQACNTLLSAEKSAHRGLIKAVKQLSDILTKEGILPPPLRMKLLILSLLIAYLEQREVFKDGYLGRFLPGANEFFEVLANGEALVNLLEALEKRFNGNVFSLSEANRECLRGSKQLGRFSKLIEGREVAGGQLSLWKLYSFKDLPVELISHIYELFVKDANSSVYTPPFLVRLMLEESLNWDRLDRLHQRGEIILDPSCGSGVFLVEAYKRLVLHWRSQNQWEKPSVDVLKDLLQQVHGIDLEAGAVELAAFSLCLALCDALEPEAIRKSIKLFPVLAGNTLHHSCFFEAKEQGILKRPIGVVVGNPPFVSRLTTPGAERSYARYKATHGSLPDKQLAYLFLHESMEMVAEGGVLSMLQQYNFLYNQRSLEFRRSFIAKWDVRELLDFISVRGLFRADTKAIVVLAEVATPPVDRKILHATFRRSGRVDAELGFDIDYYDLHWLSRNLALTNDAIWRINLLGGGRALEFVNRMKQMRTLGQYAEEQQWDFGEGVIEGGNDVSRPADHVIGKPLLPSEALTLDGINIQAITTMPIKAIEGPRSAQRFTPPMLLIREQEDMPHAIWSESYLTYKNKIVGFTAPKMQQEQLMYVDQWLTTESVALRAFVACVSVRLFTQKATTLSAADVLAIPYPETDTLDLSNNEKILVEDIVNYYREFIRLGEDSAVMIESGHAKLSDFTSVFSGQINTVYKKNSLRILEPQSWSGVICQPFVFGKGKVNWSGADELKDKLDALLHEQQGVTLQVTRICRIYDGNFVFLLKPDRLRYWLSSVALRDADETLSDLRAQGF